MGGDAVVFSTSGIGRRGRRSNAKAALTVRIINRNDIYCIVIRLRMCYSHCSVPQRSILASLSDLMYFVFISDACRILNIYFLGSHWARESRFAPFHKFR